MNQRNITIAAGIAAGLLLGAGLIHLFLLRFQAGDIYPPYSSLRADPLGAKALYESFARCAGLSVSRNYQDISRLDLPEDSTLLFLGDTVSFDPNNDYVPRRLVGQLNSFMREGGRLVITLQPRTWEPPEDDETDETEEASKADAEKKKEGNATNRTERAEAESHRHKGVPEKDDELDDAMALTNWLGTAFALALPKGIETAMLATDAPPNDLPVSLSCHTAICFSNAVPDWRVIYARDGRPVMMERRIGKGSFVLSSLSFFASNEALRDVCRPALLAWLAGKNHRIIFDETHHGIFESPGMAWLMRKYRLHWLGVGLLVLAGLFVWQNAMSLVPSYRPLPSQGPEIAYGKDSTAGLVNILRQNVPKTTVLSVCVREWKRTLARTDPETEKNEYRVAAILEREKDASPAQRDPAVAYNDICRILKKKDERIRRENK